MDIVIGKTVVQTIGLDLTLKCISTLTSSAQGIYSLIKSINSNASDQPDIQFVIADLDLGMEVKILDALIKDINIETQYTETLALCIESLKECVEQLESELVDVQKKLEWNSSLRIFKYYRSYGFEGKVEKFRLLKSNMNGRKAMLFDVLKINQHLNKKTIAPLLALPAVHNELLAIEYPSWNASQTNSELASKVNAKVNAKVDDQLQLFSFTNSHC